MRPENYYSDLEAKVCRLLDGLPQGHSMTRARIGAALYPDGTGSTILASVLGTLLTKKYIERRLPAFRERGTRYAITSLGSLAVELLDAMEEGAA